MINPLPHNTVLEECLNRHPEVFPFFYEAIDLAHLAYAKVLNETSKFLPGIPCTRASRTNVNDLACRFLQSITTPLIESGQILEHTVIDGGNVTILPDGTRIRIKKGDKFGNTSNYRTRKIKYQSVLSDETGLFGQKGLDLYTIDGGGVDVVFVAGDSFSEFTTIGLRLCNANVSDFPAIQPLSIDSLATISPAAAERIRELRSTLTG
jgi:hypothetical protein